MTKLRTLRNLHNSPSVFAMLCASVLLLSSCGVGQSNNIFDITARNDFQNTTVITAGTNPSITVPVILNDDVVQLVDVNHTSTGLSGRPFNFDNSVTPYNTDTDLSYHINGGNPHLPPYHDPSDMAGSVAKAPGFDPTLLDTVQLVYTPVANNHGVDWFSYTPLGINGASDTAYVFVRYVRIAQDRHEPDDFIQFARDITDFIFPRGQHLYETHNSDYNNPVPRPCAAYGNVILGMNIAGDRDWWVFRIPSGMNNANITIKGSTPHQLDWSDRGSFQDTENELCITLIEEATGLPPQYLTGLPNLPIAERYTQNPDFPLPRPYWITSRPSGAFTHLVQLNRNSKNPTPEGLWFKWKLDADSQFLNRRKVFIRVNPRPRIMSAVCGGTPVYEPHGDYRIDIVLGRI